MHRCLSVCTSPELATASDGRSRLARLDEWLAASRSHRVICLVLGIALINAFDLVFTILAHEQGLMYETNPFAYHFLLAGTVPIIIYKVTLVLGGCMGLLCFRQKMCTELAAISVLAVYVLIAMRWHICYRIYLVCVTGTVDWAEAEALGLVS